MESLQGIVDEIVVVDTGSEDGTVEIASGFTDRLFSFAWIDDFAAARNFSLEQATGDYILCMDADEQISNPSEARGLLTQFVNQHGDNVVGTVEIISPIGQGPDAKLAVAKTQRFFKRGCLRFAGAIHEQLVSVSGEKRAAPTGVRCFHSGYAYGPDSPRHRSHRNKRILARELAEHPDDEYYLYQLGKAHFGLNEYAEARAMLERALAAILFEPSQPPAGRLGPVAPEALQDLVVSLAYAYANLDQLDKAAGLLEAQRALGHTGTQCADFYHVMGYVYLMRGDIARSKDAYTESLRYGTAGEQVLGTGSFASFYHLGLLSEAEQDIEQALGHYVRALAAKPDYAPAIGRCIDLITERRIALPPEVWGVCDHEAFMRQFLEKLAAFMGSGDSESAALLIAATRASAPEIFEKCVATLEGAGEKGEHDED